MAGINCTEEAPSSTTEQDPYSDIRSIGLIPWWDERDFGPEPEWSKNWKSSPEDTIQKHSSNTGDQAQKALSKDYLDPIGCELCGGLNPSCWHYFRD